MTTEINASLDTNILLRVILCDNKVYFKKALKILTNKDNLYFVDDIVFHEIEFILRKHYAFDRRSIAICISDIILTRNNISCRNKSLIFQVLEDYVIHPKLSFTDCYLVRNAWLNSRFPLLTFDKKLAHQLPVVQLLD